MSDTHRDGVWCRRCRLSRAHAELRQFLCALLADCVRSGGIRVDVPASELAVYCLHALNAARRQPSKAAVRRLVTVTLDGLRPPASAGAP